MPIPFFRAKQNPKYEEVACDVIRSGKYIGGEYVRVFEDAVAERYNVKHAIGVGSGSDAVYLACEVVFGGTSNWVACPTLTFVATAESIFRMGSIPTFRDVDDETLCSDSRDVNVNLYGNRITQECKVQDMAQAMGQEFVGEVGCFSFFPTKSLGCIGDGGMIITDNDEYADIIRSMAQHGRSKEDKYTYERHGINSRLDAIQAAILSVKLEELDDDLNERRVIADRYDIELVGYVRLPYQDSTFNYYTIRTDNRDDLKKYLDSKEIASMIYFPKPLHKYDLFPDADCPVAEKACEEVLALPIYPNMPLEEVDTVCDVIKECVDKKRIMND